MRTKSNFRCDVVIFDIDNVLIDTRLSYTDCIRETVQRYLETALKFKPSSHPLLSRQDVENFKLLGGFNDDWDSCYGILLYLLSLKPVMKSVAALRQAKNMASLSARIRPPLFVKGAEQRFGRKPAVFIEKIAEIFQRLYWKKYISRETPVLPPKVISALVRNGIKVAVATGRNKREAVHGLRRAGLLHLIRRRVTLDDLPSSKFKKPNPYSLLRIADTFGRNLDYLYVGDLPDDVETANRARRKISIRAWGFSYAAVSKEKTSRALRKAGADRVVKAPSELAELLLRLKPRRN